MALTVVVAASASASASAADSAKPAATISVLPLRGDGVPLNVLQRFNLTLRQRAATRGGFAVQGEALTTELLEAAQGLGLDCDINDAACAVELGRIADAGFVLLGTVAGEVDGAGAVGVDLRIVDVAQRLERRRVTALLTGDVDARGETFIQAAHALFDTSPQAALRVSSEPTGATVLVDGVARGLTPLDVGGLLPGAHRVELRHKGHLAAVETLSLGAAEQAQLAVTLVVDPDALRTGPTALEVAVPFGVAGGGVLLAVGGGVAAWLGAGPWLAFEQHTAEIARLGREERGAPSYATAVARAHSDATTAAADWATWGQPTFVAGAAVGTLGALLAVGGVAWGSVLLAGGVAPTE